MAIRPPFPEIGKSGAPGKDKIVEPHGKTLEPNCKTLEPNCKTNRPKDKNIEPHVKTMRSCGMICGE
jgi:hypothetical protein